MVLSKNWVTMISTLTVKVMSKHINAVLEDVKTAGKRSAQGSGGKTTKQERRAAKRKG